MQWFLGGNTSPLKTTHMFIHYLVIFLIFQFHFYTTLYYVLPLYFTMQLCTQSRTEECVGDFVIPGVTGD